MSTDSTPTTALALTDDQTEFHEKQVAALRQLGVGDASRADLAVFFHVVRRTGLDPFARQIYMIGRRQKVNGEWVEKQTLQTGIDGFRLIARRAATKARETLEYEDTLFCGEDGVWRDVWLDPTKPPTAAKVVVLRDGKRFPAVALFHEYAATREDRTTSAVVLTGQWATKPAVMIAKCAEALALRKAFPQDLSGLYTDDELGHEDTPTVTVQREGPAASPEAASKLRAAAAAARAEAEPAQAEPDVVDAQVLPSDDDNGGERAAEAVDAVVVDEPVAAMSGSGDLAGEPAGKPVALTAMRKALLKQAEERFGPGWEAELTATFGKPVEHITNAEIRAVAFGETA